ncbi:hypothetical protein BDZ45DRAFT_810158 [Acephala macrosclerotiorum]|nr:hypothetical protein BDZ45DRAFT_810158 [Acephala macrosclerotiorum]
MGDRTADKASTYVETSLVSGKQIHKRLIVCCDGTWNAGDLESKSLTNVAKIARCISDVDSWKGRDEEITYTQIVHYQPGVGMGTSKAANVYDAMTGRGLSKAIRAAYTFICLNWSTEKDEIVLIGFSRGAFTVRCVAQFIEEVGLLTKSGLRHLPRLFKMWKKLKPREDFRNAWDLLKKRCEDLVDWKELVQEVEIQACAVWDTVSAVGFPMAAKIPRPPQSRYCTVGKTIPTKVKFAVQALALDERRRHFEPMIWEARDDGERKKLSQCWFAGNHGDVGGGNKDMTLANITLAWMIGQLTDKIQFNRDNLWAITTTRSWSRPSATDNPEASETSRDERDCKVVATAPISSKLLRSEDSWASFFQRRLGGAKSRRSHQDNTSIHYSFEGDILDKWAKHILCAHINLKQARDSREYTAVQTGSPSYSRRVKEVLLPEASYEALIPIAAILSAFHRLAKYQPHNGKPLNHILEQVKAQSQSRDTSNQDVAARTLIQPKFKFEGPKVEPTDPQDSSATPPELVLRGEPGKPVLVLTRTFRLLMGRAHVLPDRSGPQQNHAKKNDDEIRPCKFCAKIWPPDT